MSANPLARDSPSGTGSNMGSGPPPARGVHSSLARGTAFDSRSGHAPAPSAAAGSSSEAGMSLNSYRSEGALPSRYEPATTRHRLPATGVDRHHSISTTLGPPLSRMVIRSDDDMEEGEILDEGEGPDLGRSSANGVKRRRSSIPRKFGQGPYEHYSPPSSTKNLSNGARPSGNRSGLRTVNGDQGRDSPKLGSSAIGLQAYGSVSASRPITHSKDGPQAIIQQGSLVHQTDLSEAEARKYMDLIHTLLKDGQSPDVLVERGANPKYVTAVCEEIVQGTLRRKEVSIEAKPISSTTYSPRPTHGDSISSIPEGTAQNPIIGSPSSDDVEVIVSTDRRMSMSSEGSAEFQLIEKPSPPRSRMTRIMPSSSWAPTIAALPAVQAVTPAHPSQSIRIDRYTPSQPAQSSGRRAPIVDSFVPGAVPPQPIISTASPPAAILDPLPPTASLPERPPFADNAIAGPSRLPHDVPTGPRNTGVKRPKRNKKKRFEDEADAEVQVLNYDDEFEAPTEELKRPKATSVPVAIDPRAAPPAPTPAPVFNPSAAFNQSPIPHFLPTPATVSLLRTGATYPAKPMSATPAAPTATQLEIKAKNDMLEIRRRALASMKLRKARKSSPEKESVELPSVDPPMAASVTTIEQEVLDLEQEVIGLQAIADATPDEGTPMELDSSDSGQDTPSIPPATLPNASQTSVALAIPPIVPASSSLPTRRGIKRPNAEDMMELQSRPSSSAPSWIRRKPFGGLPQKPNRLLVNLDDQSDSESEDGETGFSTPPVMIKNVMVEDKEAQIRALRAKIAAIQAKKKAATAGTSGVASPASGSPGSNPVVVQSDNDASATASARAADGAVTMTAEAADAAVDNAERAIAAAEISIVTANLPRAISKRLRRQAVLIPAVMTESAPSATSEMDMDIDETEDAVNGAAVIERDKDVAPIEVHSSPHPAPVADGDDDEIIAIPTPSAPAQAPVYKAYTPLLGRYPQLSATSHSTQSFSQYSSAPARPLKLHQIFNKLDRGFMSSIMLTHRLARNPSAMLCPAEVGGGMCADAKCPFLHLDKDEPTGEDWTEYTYQVMSRTREGTVDRKLVQKAVASVLGKQLAKGKGKAQPQQGYGKALSHKRDAVQKALEIVLAGIGIGIAEAEKAAAAAGKASAA